MATRDKQKQANEESILSKLQHQAHELIESFLEEVKPSMPVQIARAIIYAWIDLNALQHTDMQHWYNSWDFSSKNKEWLEKIIVALKKTKFVDMSAYVEDAIRKLLCPSQYTILSRAIHKKGVDNPFFWYTYLRFELYGSNTVLLQTDAAKKTQNLIVQYLLTKRELLSKELGFNPANDGWLITFLQQFFLSEQKEQIIQTFIKEYFDYIACPKKFATIL